MLKKWIDEIRQKSDLYRTDCWKYHISGNVIELSIMTGYLKQKKIYRCSVIAIGQVLEALSTKIEQESLNSHIQSFPSLETPEIVASIRIGEKGEFTDRLNLEKGDQSQKKDPSSIIHNLVNRYQLEIKQVEYFEEINIAEIPLKDYTTWFVVYSLFNNPFTWLKIGYLKESIRTEYLSQSEDKDLYMADLYFLGNDQYPNLSIPETKYLQYLIGLHPINVSPG